MIGDIVEQRVILRLMEKGYSVNIPTSVEAYDCIIDDRNGNIQRVQIKKGRVRKGKVIFNPFSNVCKNGVHSKKYYDGKIDLFIVYLFEYNTMSFVENINIKSFSISLEKFYENYQTI